MSAESQKQQMIEQLRYAAVQSLAATGELPKIKAHIAAHLYAELHGIQKTENPQFQSLSQPSKQEFDQLVQLLQRHNLTSTLKVLYLELGTTGEYHSVAASAHATSESMSISPNRYTQAEADSSRGADEPADFEIVPKQHRPSEPKMEDIAAMDALNFEYGNEQ